MKITKRQWRPRGSQSEGNILHSDVRGGVALVEEQDNDICDGRDPQALQMGIGTWGDSICHNLFHSSSKKGKVTRAC